MSPRPERLILIHGAWAGGWVWQRLEASLGVPSVTLELPGNGHHPIPASKVSEGDYLDCVGAAIRAVDGPVGLIGHSGGGMLVTAAANAFPDQVTHGIWIAGMLLPRGQSFDDVLDDLPARDGVRGVAPHVTPALDGKATCVPREAAKKYFFHDLPQDGAGRAADWLSPQPVAGRRIRVTAGKAFSDLPKLYIHASQDRSVVPEAQSAMCNGVKNLTIAKVASGHVPHISHAEDTAAIIRDWLAKT